MVIDTYLLGKRKTMSRALALLLLLGAACFSAMAADPAPGVPAATAPVKTADPVQAPVPAPATTPVSKEAPASTPVQAENKKKGSDGTTNVDGLWEGAYCCATLTVNGQSANFFNPNEIPTTTPPGSIFVPPVADNTDVSSKTPNCITMGTNHNIFWATEFYDRSQLLIATLEFDADGKVTLTYLVNSKSHHAKMDLHKAQIQLTCDSSTTASFDNVVGFLPDHKKSNFPHEVKTTYSKTTKTFIMDIHPLKTGHHCSLHKAVWVAALCQKSDGPCCQNGRFVAGQRSHICRKSNSPCVQDAYCDGVTAKCLQADFEPENKACGWNARHGELYSASIQHTRLPQSSAVSIASITGKPTSYDDLEQCTGKCNGKGTCVISATEGCCKESSYGYEEEYKSNDYYDSYGKDDYDKYAKDDYKYGKHDDKYGKDDYDKYVKDDYDYGKYGKKEDDYDKYGKKDDDYGKYGKKDTYAAIASGNDKTNTGTMISCFTGNTPAK